MGAASTKEANTAYQNNKITITDSGPVVGPLLARGTFTITKFFITPGQDPDGHVKIGQTYESSTHLDTGTKNGATFAFSIGRSGSGAAADWFNSQITSSENTFHHDAGKLHFALMGTLTLVVYGQPFDPIGTSITFDNVCLAQGKVGLWNNWWFGAKGATYVGHNTISLRDSSDTYTFRFTRGGIGNPVDRIVLSYPPPQSTDIVVGSETIETRQVSGLNSFLTTAHK